MGNAMIEASVYRRGHRYAVRLVSEDDITSGEQLVIMGSGHPDETAAPRQDVKSGARQPPGDARSASSGIHLLLSLPMTFFVPLTMSPSASSTTSCVVRLVVSKYNGKSLRFAVSIKGPSSSHTGGRGKS